MSQRARFDVAIRVGHHYDHVVHADRLRIGRLAIDNDVVLDGESVSGHHAELLFRDGVFLIRDTASLVGTLLNGRQVAEHALSHGDTVVIGSFRLSIDLSEPECLRGQVDRDPKLSLQRLVVEYRRTHHGDALGRAMVLYGAGGVVLAAACLGLVLLLGGWSAFAPGPLLPGHTGTEGPQGCSDCHAPMGGPVADRCVDCHDRAAVRHDAVAEVAVQAMSCSDCHVEHQRIEGLWAGSLRPDGCVACHDGVHPERVALPVIERAVGAFAPPFSHADHTATPELDCRQCHPLGAPPRVPAPGSFEGCVSCHPGWEVGRHSHFEQCGGCHGASEPEHDASEGPYVHEIAEACLRCHPTGSLFSVGLVVREVPSPQGFVHTTPEHEGSCSDCHPDMELARRVVDVKTVTPGSPACQRCHGAEPAQGACPDCHLFHDGPRRPR